MLLLAPMLLLSAADDPLAAMKAKVKDPDKPFTVVVKLQVKPDAADKLITACKPAIEATRKEAGNLRYELNRDSEDPNTFVMLEQWKNWAAMEAHLKQGYTTAVLKAAGDLAAAPPDIKVLVPVAGS